MLEKLFSQSKNELRKQLKIKRKNIENKTDISNAIFEKLISCDEYKKADQILCYVSYGDEISTNDIIEYSLNIGKKVAVPYCVDDKGTMEFYYINSFDDLVIGSFGIREPSIKKCDKVTNFDNSIIVVPALSFDKNGYRIGYGKGYYDRFLQKHPLKSIGLCYNTLVLDELPIDKYDRNVNIVITEKQMLTIGG